MNKTTVRFIAVGTVLLLGAVAMALAQHDARERPRENPVASLQVDEPPQPIPVDDVDPTWNGTASHSQLAAPSLVRANDDRSLSPPPSLAYEPEPAGENPLRPLAPLDQESDQESAQVESLGRVSDRSSVTTASGEAPAGFPSLPTLPPSLVAAPPSSAAGGISSAPPSSLPAQPGSLPLAGMSPQPNLAAQPSDLQPPEARAVQMLAPPGWVNSGPASSHRALSDTQRPPMPTTNLSSPSHGGGQPWLQAPATLPGNGGANAAAGNSVGDARVGAVPRADSGLGSAVGIATQGHAPLAPSATLGLPQPASPPATLSPTTPAAATPAYSSTPSAAQSRGPLVSTGTRSPLGSSAFGTLISNQPGNRHLDGSQNPVMIIQKRMAGECQVGKRATVVITVRNAGNSTAQEVEVIDSIPVGASFAEAIPAVAPTTEGILIWPLGEMAPGDERTINLQIVPQRQGELGSTAVVRFAAQASVRTLATLPQIEITQSSSPEVLIGSPHAIDVVVKNVGTGVARGVRLEADLPANVHHESGNASLEASFGDIAPNESKHIRLDTMATEPGMGVCDIRALTEDGLQQQQKVDLRVLAPALQATVEGPSKRYLDRQATFEVVIKNTGTAPATNCEFVVRLPSGLNFNTANKAGTYDPKQHAVFWSVAEFPAGHAEPVELTVLPVEVGTQAMSFQGSADLGVKVEAGGSLTVEEQGELAFRIEQDADPIEVSSSTTFTIEVRNVGRADHNVQLAVQLPSGSKALKVDAPVKYSIQGDQLLFEPIPEMESRAVQKFRVEVGNLQVGTQIVRAQLRSQNRPTPVIKEEATDVYNDRN